MEIKNVEFSYGNHKVLNDISFKVQEGKITTIIGANGCGKSTLFNVITKNLKPQKGSVLLNGEDIKHISLKNFARQVAIVHQYNTAPSDITVEKLVSYGRIAHIDKGRRNYADDEKYINFAMEVTGVSEFAKKQISNLSGGQKQRLTIARALVKNPDILILDDSASALDFATDARLRKAIKEQTQNRTVFLVSQRVSTIRNADQILVLDDGTLAGIGTHEELLRENEVYQEICASQLSKEEVPYSVKTAN